MFTKSVTDGSGNYSYRDHQHSQSPRPVCVCVRVKFQDFLCAYRMTVYVVYITVKIE